MKIDLSDDLRVVSTKYAWQLEQRTRVKGKDRWRAYKWFISFGDAVSGAVHDEIRAHPAQTLADAIKAVDSIVHRYAQMIPCEFELRPKDDP